jgi:uncharacterized membrane protein
MLKYLIQVVQNSLGAAILTALLSILVYQDGPAGPAGPAELAELAERRRRQRRRFAGGCIAGAAAALVLAVLRRTTVLINREYFNIAVLSAAVVVEIGFIIFFWLPKKPLGIRDRIQNISGTVTAGALLFYTLPTIFLYPAEFLMAGQSLWSTDFLFNLTGFLAGLLVTGLSALALFKSGRGLLAGGGTKLNRLAVQFVLTVNLGITMITQLTALVQFLLARRMIRVPRRFFKVLIFLINNNRFFLYVLLALCLIIPVLVLINTLRREASYANPAERRKDRAGRRRLRRWCAVTAVGCLFSVFSLTVLKSYNERGVVLSPAEPMTIKDGEIFIPLERIEDWRLHRFAHITADGVEVRFIVIRKNEAAYGVGLDACDICGATGYYERKNQVICRLCDVVMNVSTIGFKGGCNPVPLASTIRDGQMVILLEDLENEQGRFK